MKEAPPPAVPTSGPSPAAAPACKAAAPPADPLHDPTPLTAQQIESYQRNGFIKLKGVLSPETLKHYAQFIKEEVEGVRLYHDQALFKSPGGGHTPWHCDQYYWPLGSSKTVTAWVPLVAVPEDRGPLQFAAGSQKHDLGRSVGIGRESDKHVGAAVEAGGFEVVGGPFELGDVSFHSGWTFHRADENTSSSWRNVMTMIYMDRDMVMTEPKNDNQRRDSRDWLPGVRPGEVCAGPNNPVIWQRGG
ncbi:phytanoyl-dioxygenase [Micractinium conductrix]|uniref:Phytanoyl-dioxygenase n=1 Tax=Micractinium conductrix TaxID=554055 RepID=A0A2P6VB80_9CHLO|nr:phytanoyl-dioxygenase [Micractinium conductrix]|eukprot:PSC71311.1 phytanoyl-dioxygenase [Micractinium conductrix]